MNISYKIIFHTYWHCGSGLAAGADLDLLVVRDRDGLPFVPGKTVKGLVREAAEDLITFKGESPEVLVQLFGNSADKDNEGSGAMAEGCMRFGNAVIATDREAIVVNDLKSYFYSGISSTAIESDGIAKDNSLRRMEVVVPCTLEGTISNVPKENKELVANALKMIKRLGQNRNRGLGRCDITITGESDSNPNNDQKKQVSTSKGETTVLKYKCTLLSDVILNVKSASEGANSTLDFIPGSNFLGIVARNYAALAKEKKALKIFHSGKVRFSDAHPAVSDARTNKVPAAVYSPKLQLSDKKKEYYIHHECKLDDPQIMSKQLKQCREGFYDFCNNPAIEAKTEKSFAIKSAYDRNNRRSAEAQMYGYQSLNTGAIFYFNVEVDNQELVDTIHNLLVGEKTIGRSRTAQYGLVKIEAFDYKECESREKKGEFVTIYADSRIIILDENDNPTFRPNAQDLGLNSGVVAWDKCQIRTFQYAPWNSTRQCFDTDRCGIEKGSVIVVKDCTDTIFATKYVGDYTNEGFGRVIYNPSFLSSKPGTNGEAAFELKKVKGTGESSDKDEKENKDTTVPKGGSELFKFLDGRKQKVEDESKVYESVNDYVDKNAASFGKDEKFSSQWGTIRKFAMQAKNKEELIDLLYQEPDKKKGIVGGYLMHGVAESKWEGRKRDNIKVWIEKLDNKLWKEATINLASEMAKICKRK